MVEMNVPLIGDIRDYTLPRILLDLNRKKATGTLSAASTEFTKNIYIKDGEPIFASSTIEEDRLGSILIKAGKINIEQYERSVEILKKTGKRHGVVLVDLGYLTPKELLWAVRYQVANIVYSMFQLDEGTYVFNEGPIPEEVITLKIPMANLVYKSGKKISKWTSVRNEMPVADTVFKLNDDPSFISQGVELNAQDKMILSLVDGKKTLKQLASAEYAKLSSFDIIKTLHLLWLTGFITEKGIGGPVESVQPDSEGETMLKEKIEELYKRLDRISESEILQIDKTADSATVKKSYYRLAKEFHPDRFYNSGDKELQVKLAAIFNALTKAYKILSDDTKRKEYFNPPKIFPEQKKDAHSILIRKQFVRGIEELKKSNYQVAADIFKWVTKEDPKNPNALSYLSLALSNIQRRSKDAEKALLDAIRLEPFNSRHFSDLGKIYLKAGITKRAQQQFEEALKLDPGNTDAKEGLDKITVSTNRK